MFGCWNDVVEPSVVGRRICFTKKVALVLLLLLATWPEAYPCNLPFPFLMYSMIVLAHFISFNRY